MNDEIRQTLLGRSQQQAEEWLKANTAAYGFESKDFLVKTGAKSADAPELKQAQGRFNALLKHASSPKNQSVTEIDRRIYVYISNDGNVSDVVVTKVVTGP